jgi:hypothetical protein
VNLELASARLAVQKMEAWQVRSLPADRERALSLYKAWLLDKAKAAGLAISDIKLTPSTTNSKAFKVVGYQMIGSGTLSQVAGMLFEFYRSPQLHQITKLNLTRPPGSTQLQVTIDVEALSLPGAVATDSLPSGESKRLRLASAAEYQKVFNDRDLVAVYTPPRPPGPPPRPRETPPPPPKFDESELAHFSGAIGSGASMQAWIHIRSTGETLHLKAGDPIKVGALEGQIESINERALVLKTGDKKFRVPLGESLRKGKELDENGQIKADPPAESPQS